MEKIGTKAFVFAVGTFISRMSGLLREVMTAAILGANAEVGAFMLAYRFSLMFRRLLGEGGLLFGFIPYYEEIQKQSETKARQFFVDLTYSLAALLIGMVLLLEGLACFLKDTRAMAMLMVPGLFFLVLAALWGALLQCRGRFFAVGCSPALINGIWILFLCFFKTIEWLAFGVTVAFIVQWVFLSPRLLPELRGIKPHLFAPDVRQLFNALSWVFIGVATAAFSGCIDMVFARSATGAGPAYLAYAIRIQQLPLGLVAIAFASALLPALTRTEPAQRFALLQTALAKTCLFLTPCAITATVLSKLLVSLLYGRGAFDETAILYTARALQGYGVALLPWGSVLVINQFFYANKNYRTPVIASVAAITLHLFLNTLCIFWLHFGPESVTWVTAASSFFHLLLMRRALGRSLFGIKALTTWSAAAAISISIPFLIQPHLSPATSPFTQCLHLIFLGTALTLAFALFYLKHIPALATMMGSMQKKWLSYSIYGFLALTFIVVKFGWKKVHGEHPFLIAHSAFHQWMKEMQPDTPSFLHVQTALKKHPELRTAYLDPVIQRLIALDEREIAPKMLKERLKALEKSQDPYDRFSANSIRITLGRREKALEEALQLKEALLNNRESHETLFAFNLLRIALLSGQTEEKLLTQALPLLEPGFREQQMTLEKYLSTTLRPSHSPP